MEDLKKLIESVNYISFDIFDTLILRSVEKPVDIFLIVEELYTQQTSKQIASFVTNRMEAEKVARDHIWSSQQRSEVTIDEIYEKLSDVLKIPDQDIQQLKQLELSCELNCCHKNPFMFDLYQYCKEQNKKIIITSDIYLPEELIQSILVKNGYTDYMQLFVSSCLNKTKSTGELFQHVLDILACKGEDILHIGDNFHSDIKMAKAFSITTFYYKKCLDLALKNKLFTIKKKSLSTTLPALEKSIYLASIIKYNFSYRKNTAINNQQKRSFWYSQGYEQIGIFYLGFASWLISELLKDDITKVYFLARDGYIMQKVYEKLKLCGFDCTINSDYLYASRRALNIPSIETLEDQDINFLISGTSRLRVKDFLNRVGLDSNLYQKQCLQVGFNSIEDLIDSGKDYKQLRQLFMLLENSIKTTATVERSALQQYFKQKGLLTDKKLAFVDIGWHGSLQRSLKKLLHIMQVKANMKGYYLGTFPPAKDIVEQGHKMSAFLCEQGEPHHYHQLIKQSVEIFEFIHGAPHGSVIKMENQNGKLSCIFDQDIDETGRGEKVNQLQQGALDFIDDYLLTWRLFNNKTIDKDFSVAPIKRLLTSPTIEEANNYGNLEHAEGYGDIYIKRFIAKPDKFLLNLFFMPVKLLKDYRQSFWRTGFLKRCKFFWT